MKTCASLIRVSTGLQTVENQRAPILAWAKSQGIEDVVFYEEDGVSGASKERPVRDAMLEACRDGKHDVIAVVALDRVGRRASEVVLIVDELRRLNVRLVSLREGLDFGTTIGCMVASVLAFVAQLEREVLSQRTAAGFMKNADGVTVGRLSGRKVGRPGYLWTPAADAELLRLLEDVKLTPEEVREKDLLRLPMVSATGATVSVGTPGASTLRARWEKLSRLREVAQAS